MHDVAPAVPTQGAQQHPITGAGPRAAPEEVHAATLPALAEAPPADPGASSAAAASVLSHWAEPAPAGPAPAPPASSPGAAPPALAAAPGPAAPVPLAASGVHVPPTATRGAVPLSFSGLSRGADGHLQRQGGPTTVRVILDRFEELHDEFLTPGKVNVLGSPEVVTLVPGDDVEIYTWNNSVCQDTVAVGFVCDRPLADVFTGLRAEVAAGADNKGKLKSPPEIAGNAIFGMEFSHGKMGGVCIRGKVKPGAGPAPLRVALTQVCKRAADAKTTGQAGHAATPDNEDISTGRRDQMKEMKKQHPHMKDADIETAVRDKNHRGFHEQAQFYGDLAATAAEPLSERQRVIAAPGASAYGARLDRAHNVEDRAAGYWVPIAVPMHPADGITKVRIEPDEQARAFAGEASVEVHAVTDDGVAFIPAGTVLLERGKAAAAKEHKAQPTFDMLTLTKDIPLDDNGHARPFTLHVKFLGAAAAAVKVSGVRGAAPRPAASAPSAAGSSSAGR